MTINNISSGSSMHTLIMVIRKLHALLFAPALVYLICLSTCGIGHRELLQFLFFSIVALVDFCPSAVGGSSKLRNA